MPETYQLEIDGDASAGLPRFHAELSRVNAVLGANGSGKSKLIQRLRNENQAFGGSRPVVYVEGGRVVDPPASVGLDRHNINQFQNLQHASERYVNRRRKVPLSERASELFVLLDRKGERVRTEHSDAVQEWIEGGQEGEPPKRNEPPLELLFDRFHDIFPAIELSIEPDSRDIQCRQNESTYGPSQLSDGERQVLALLADVALESDPNSLILVDEPELNLNTQLACRLWDSIEASLPSAVFVYATHSLGFAMRGNVDRILVLSSPEDDPVTVADAESLVSEDLRPFLGAIPAILAAPAALIVEGTESSLDSIFYHWILEDEQPVVVPVGNCQHVRAAAQRTGVWQRLTSDAAVHGVIDRDYRSEEALEALTSEHCQPLRYHEVESYLCLPAVLSNLGECLGLVEDPPSEDHIATEIVDFSSERLVNIVARRVIERASVRLSISLSRQTLSTIDTTEELVRRLQNQVQKEQGRVEGLLTNEAIERMVAEEQNQLNSAIGNEAVSELLQLVPGKALLSRLAPQVGCSSHTRIARSASRHLAAEDYGPLSRLHDDLRSGLGYGT